MDVDLVVDLGRNAILTTLLVAAPVLLAGMIVGLLVGLLQAVTQVQDQTVSFVPKIIAMITVLSIVLPWLIGRMMHFTTELYTNIPFRL